MKCCGHDPAKHVVYSASIRADDGAIAHIKGFVICITHHCYCQRPEGLYHGRSTG